MAETLHFDDEYLVRYIDGELSAEERLAIESALTKTQPLQQRLEELQLAIYATKRYGDLEKVKKVHKQMMLELKPASSQTPVRKLLRYTLAAASILLLFFALRYFRNAAVDSNRLFNEAYVEFDVNATRNQNYKGQIEQAYGSKEYTRSSSLTPRSQIDSLLVGLSFLHLNQPGKAVEWLQAVQKNGGEYKPDAEFYLSLAYIKNKEFDKGYDLVQMIRSDQMHIYRDQYSDSFVRQLEKLKEKSK